MTLKPNQQLSLIDGQGRDLGEVRVDRIQGDLVLGRFTPGPAYIQVEPLFAKYVADANEQLLGIVGELDEKIARLNLRLRSAEPGALPAIHDVQIGRGTITFRIRAALTSADGPADVTAQLPTVVQENESAVARSLADNNFVQAFLLVHALIESLLRAVLGRDDDRLRFNDLINAYRMFLDQNQYPIPEFVDDLVKFNRRRNRMVHELWRKGFGATNKQTKSAAHAAVIMYGLLIDWFGTFDDSMGKKGFHLSE